MYVIRAKDQFDTLAVRCCFFKLYVILDVSGPYVRFTVGSCHTSSELDNKRLPRGRKCFVSVEGFYVKAPLTMFATKTRQDSARILARVRWYNNICICRWTMMIISIVSL